MRSFRRKYLSVKKTFVYKTIRLTRTASARCPDLKLQTMSHIGSNSRDSHVGTPAPHTPPHFHCSLSVSARRSPLRSAYLRVPSAYLCLYSAFSNAYLPEPHTGEFCVLHLSYRGAYRVFHYVNLPRYHRFPGHEALCFIASIRPALVSTVSRMCFIASHLIEQLVPPGARIQNQQDLLHHGESNGAYWWSGR